MKLPSKKTYHFFLAGNIILGGILSLLIFDTSTRNTFADEDPYQLDTPTRFVTFHDRGETLTIKTDAPTVEAALARADLALEPTDIVEPALTEHINNDNFHINIYRSRPVIVKDGSAQRYLMSASYDPATIAREAGFTLYDGDEVAPAPSNSFLETGVATTYEVSRNGGETVTVETPIPFTEQVVEDANLDSGQTKLEQMGEDGLKVAKYRINFINGVEVSRDLISEETVREPVARVILKGTKNSAPAASAYTIAPEQEECASWARQAGVSEADLPTAINLIYRESGCRYNATNRYSGAYGIPQALPASKMAEAGPDWQTNPITQIRWMIKYVNGRYGGWGNAMNWWWAHGWY